ncbi:NAD(P)/FAD-dependent oxidoreductase [Desulfonema ishimotonii]|uniref:NAD(P)/FAD-dependent oxidoreductase n=1 Tax=Desulfonema ishimotonii TaxID=45657 RepID=A0A401FVB3_9BACT|nr:FAD-dependent oxidoreductase [Desulfonema ishimotonii]GBC60906.1 NAD(P)/FAD-dependent oxidoreductase [Desulfonema ishimotonii]
MKYLIIGNGVASTCAAEAIRQLDPEGAITMVADEAFPPYCRPMISMVLEGAVPPDRLPIRDKNFYDNLKITPVLGKRATGIDVKNRRVFVPGNGDSAQTAIEFDKLLIASGADPRPVRAEGTGLKNIFYMRTEQHVRGMLAALPSARNALVLGGGLVGFKAAYGLLRRGIRVTLLIRSGYPLAMQVDETAGKMILDELIRHGLDVRVGAEVRAFGGNGTVQSAHLSDGTEIPCDMAVIGKGVLPALSFVPRDDIDTDLGIMVDEHMETRAPGIFAAGDVAEFIDIARQTRWVNAIWPEAVAQGRIAGMNMAGRPVAYRGSLSRNVIRIFGLDIMTGGIVNPPENTSCRVIRRISPAQNTYRKLVFHGETLAGMAMINNIDQGGVLLSLIQNKTPIRIPGEALLEPSFNARQVMGGPVFA